jgi:RND superfamily putative drug exporter
MKLLDEKNWYLPRWLEWLPRLEHDSSPPTERAPDTAPAAALGVYSSPLLRKKSAPLSGALFVSAD